MCHASEQTVFWFFWETVLSFEPYSFSVFISLFEASLCLGKGCVLCPHLISRCDRRSWSSSGETFWAGNFLYCNSSFQFSFITDLVPSAILCCCCFVFSVLCRGLGRINLTYWNYKYFSPVKRSSWLQCLEIFEVWLKLLKKLPVHQSHSEDVDRDCDCTMQFADPGMLNQPERKFLV